MNSIASLYNIVFYQPLLNLLVLFYEYLPGRDFGVAIIALTVFVRAILYPLSARALKAQLAMAGLQPKLREIRAAHKNNRDELNRKTFELFKQHNVNPFAALLPVLIQLPVLLALFQLLRNGFRQDQLGLLYGFVPNPGHIDPLFLGVLDLGAASIPVAIVAGASQFLQGKIATPPGQQGFGNTEVTKNIAASFFALLTGSIMLTLPSALGLYWISTNVFSMWQQWYLMRKIRSTKSEIRNT